MNKLVRFFKGRIRLFISIFFGLIVGLIVSKLVMLSLATQIIISFNSGVFLFLIMAFDIMFFSKEKDLLKNSAEQDEGKILVLLLVLGSAATSLVAIVAQLSVAKDLHGFLKFEYVALSALTIILSWFFIQMMFAIHYAHDFYLNISHKKPGGVDFPGTEAPDYADFFYLACSIGTSGQTADVAFTEQKMRRACMVHCVFTFFFNATVLALMINLLSNLL